jgi:hypothetical protein
MSNQPAFPNEGFNGWGEPEKGMTLRDYFAAKAMQGFLPDAFQEARANYPAKRLTAFWAAMAYQLADEMMKAREA